jgi:hypothetical protein
VRVSVTTVVVPDLDELRREGVRHRSLGGLLDAGSFAPIIDAGPGADGWRGVFAAAGLPVPVADDALPADGTPSGLSERYNDELARGAALVLILLDREERTRPWILVCGHRLPSMGMLPPCTTEDVVATILRLAGKQSPAEGRFLLEEPPSVLDSETDARLTERLRVLYGD